MQIRVISILVSLVMIFLAVNISLGEIADVTVTEDAADSVVNLFAAFADVEDLDPAALTYTIAHNTNPGLFTATTINDAAGTLTLDYAADQSGAADITVRATETGGQFVETTFTVTVNPQKLTTQEILRRADQARGNLAGVKWDLHILSLENKRKQERTIDVKARGYDFLAVMTSPARVKEQKLLMVQHNMWFAKPGLRKPVPISPRQKLTGGAANGDIAATNYANDYEVTGLGDDIIDGESCYVLDLKAINKKATYDRIKYWISKQRLVGVKAEFFTVSGKMFKWARFEYENRVTIRNEPYLFISKIFITDALISNNVTTMNISNPILEELPDSTFNLNFLMRR